MIITFFNVRFRTLLGAACERKSVLLFDPTTRSLISHVSNAHDDSVNCIRFLDNRLFSTCSDDTTVALWDARYLKKKLRSMRGHQKWVKNIEYSAKDNYLVTSGFDGAIFAWDINKYVSNVSTHSLLSLNVLQLLCACYIMWLLFRDRPSFIDCCHVCRIKPDQPNLKNVS